MGCRFVLPKLIQPMSKVIRETLTDSDNREILKQEVNNDDNTKKIRSLPYRFRDLVGISK